MTKRFRTLWKEDKGAAMILVGTMMLLLVGMAAFGSDLAWFYLNTSRVQRTADAAALAGVVWMPGQAGTAFSTAQAVAVQNGYDTTAAETTVTPATITGQANQLKVTVNTTVPTFFLRALGVDTMTIERSSVAEYIPPLKLGSPTNQFGNTCDPTQAGCTNQANFWANIHGRWTSTVMGDAYSSFCATATDDPNCAQNPIARETGYLYGITSSSSFTVQFNDLAFRNIAGGQTTSDYIRTGDRGCEDWGNNTASCGASMYVALFAPDPTPLDLSDNGAPLCQATIPPIAQVAPTAAYSFTKPDTQACWTQTGAGIYVLQVKVVNSGTTADRAGLNRYGVKSTTGNLFALGDFSLYNNASGLTTAFYLAEVPSFYAGKTFVVELYDAGESAANGNLQVIAPSGSVYNLGECRISSRDNTTQAWGSPTVIAAGSPCQELVTPGEYNGRWVKFELDLPPSYSCATCWFKMNYAYTSGVNDTTTWKAYMIGNPIHLVAS